MRQLLCQKVVRDAQPPKILRVLFKSRGLRLIVSCLLFCFVASYINGRYFIPMLFAWVCHETGHLLAGYCLNIKIRLTSPGMMGLALDTDLCCQGYRESLLAAAGPLVNLLLAYISFRMQYMGYQLTYFYEANLVLALGNLLPVMPLDGGKILRGIFSRYWGWLNITKILVYLGQVLGILITIAIFWFSLNIWLIVLPIAIYVLTILDDRNSQFVLYQAMLATQGDSKKKRRIISLRKDISIAQAIRKLSPGYDNELRLKPPNHKRVVIPEARLLEAWSTGRGNEKLSGID